MLISGTGQRAPGFQSHALRLGLTLRQAAFVRDDRLTVPLQALTQSEPLLPWLNGYQQYIVGPYLLAQAIAEGGSASDSRVAWQALRSALLPTTLDTWGSAISEAEVDAALTTIGVADFYEDRVLGARWGEPLVSVRVVETAGVRSFGNVNSQWPHLIF